MSAGKSSENYKIELKVRASKKECIISKKRKKNIINKDRNNTDNIKNLSVKLTYLVNLRDHS